MITEVIAAAVPIQVAHTQKCARKLARGEVKRVMGRGPLVGYYIACPACGFSAAYLEDTLPPGHSCRFVETGADAPFTLVGITNPPPCYSCHRILRVVDGQLQAV